jgi:hypothetical protein
MNLHGGLETLLLLPFRCVEVVVWPFVVIAVGNSCAHSLLVKKPNNVSWAKKNMNLHGGLARDATAAAAAAAVSMC